MKKLKTYRLPINQQNYKITFVIDAYTNGSPTAYAKESFLNKAAELGIVITSRNCIDNKPMQTHQFGVKIGGEKFDKLYDFMLKKYNIKIKAEID